MRKELPKVYEPQEVESRIYEMWENNGCFAGHRDPEKKPFTLANLNPLRARKDDEAEDTGDGKKMIMVSFVMSQYAEILGAVGKIDPDAFVIVHRAHEINGEGWSRPRGSEKAK